MSGDAPTRDELGRKLRAAEADLASLRARFDTILRTSMDGFWILDMQGRFVDVNQAYCQMVGHPREELLGMAISDIDAAETPEETAAHIERIAQTGSDRFVTRHRRRDGTIIDVEVSTHRLANEDAFFAFARDVTEHIQQREALRRSHRRLEEEVEHHTLDNVLLRTAVEQLPVVVIVTDAEGRISYVNRAFEETTGYAASEVHGKNPRLLKSGAHEEGFYRKMWETITMGRTWHGEVVNRRRDGTLYAQELTVAPVKDRKGAITHFVATGRDVTTERALRRSVEFTQLAVDLGSDMVLWVDATGKLTYANQSALRNLGYDAEEIGATSWWDLVRSASPAEWPQAFDTLRRTRSAIVETHLIRKDGSTMPVEIVVTHVERGDQELQFAIARDQTERYEAQAALKASERRYHQLVESLHEAVVVNDRAGRLLFANRLFREWFGVASDALESIGLDDYVMPDQRERLREAHGQQLQGSRDPGRVECEGLRVDGSRIWMEILITAVEKDGVVIGTQSAIRDITGRREAEQAIRDTAQLLVRSQRVARLGSYRLRLSSQSWEGSAVVREILGFRGMDSGRDLDGWLRAIHPEDRPEVTHRLQKASTTEPLDIEYRITRLGDGSEHWVHQLGEVVCDRDGEPVELIGTVQDVTERRRAEEARGLAEERLSAIVRTAKEGIITIGEDSRIETFNPAAEQLFGYSQDEILGSEVTVLMSEPHRGRHKSYVSAFLDSGASALSTTREIVGRRKNGVEFPSELSLSVFEVAGNRVFAGIFRDLTEERKAQGALRESEARHRALINALPDLIFVLDENDRILDYHSADRSLLHAVPGAFLGRPLEAVLPEDTARGLLSAGRDARSSGELQTFDYTLETHAGPREFEARMVPMDEGSITAVVREVTERNSIERQLRQSQKLEAIGSLAGGVAHDFNNIVTGILAFAGFARDALPTDLQARSDLDEVLRAGRRAADLTRQLLAFSRQQIVRPRLVDVNDLVRGVEKLLRRLLGEDIDLGTTLHPSLWHAWIDPGQLEQVLLNLAVNARDAMPMGGKLSIETSNVTFDEDYTRVHPGAQAGDYLLLAVSDNGTGMTPEVLARVFEPFFSTKGKDRGTGLGLATCHGIVKQAGGSINVYSEPGRGTTFRIYLPRCLNTPGDSDDPAQEASRVEGGNETILVAEDDAAVRASVVRILGSLGYRVLDGATPEEAIEVAASHTGPIDLLLTDVVMPGLNGRELADRLQEGRPAMKVLYMSGYTNHAIVHQGELDPSVSYIEKPFSPEQLARNVRMTLDGHSSP